MLLSGGIHEAKDWKQKLRTAVIEELYPSFIRLHVAVNGKWSRILTRQARAILSGDPDNLNADPFRAAGQDLAIKFAITDRTTFRKGVDAFFDSTLGMLQTPTAQTYEDYTRLRSLTRKGRSDKTGARARYTTYGSPTRTQNIRGS